MFLLQDFNILKNNFDGYPDSVFIKDSNFRYQYLNKQIIKDMALEEKNTLDKGDTEMYHAQYASIYNAHDEACLKGQIYYQLEKVPVPYQSELFSLTLKNPLKDHNGVVSGILGFCTFMDYEALVFCLKLKKNNLTRLKIADNCYELIEKNINLSSRELQVLFYFLQGKSAKHIAYQLNIAEVTVNFHLNNIKDKWQCFSKEGIFNKALQKGLFGFSGIWNLLQQSTLKLK
ncbi:helix-turn-helix transcriptional regulator [Legionella sp. km535]|uniref:PAS and helix-turn-helix domain-containing protein n=1 Tax=Legionella sp. km535 TaxID=2498107 RepID=UPI000F8F5C99|nr:PAS and helix-turn-helix domain-containing protein [Legionella sp. km535]RUR19042.1 helix-turn-helix transcriptional regulator [Legionella sp. km535]